MLETPVMTKSMPRVPQSHNIHQSMPCIAELSGICIVSRPTDKRTCSSNAILSPGCCSRLGYPLHAIVETRLSAFVAVVLLFLFLWTPVFPNPNPCAMHDVSSIGASCRRSTRGGMQSNCTAPGGGCLVAAANGNEQLRATAEIVSVA